jgi:hypothetical protein
MSETAFVGTEEEYEPAEGLDPDVTSEYYETQLAAATIAPKRALTATMRQPEFTQGISNQLEYVAHLSARGERYLRSHPFVAPHAVVWRLVAAVATASGIAAAGLTLFAVALTGRPFEPNPYIALAVLLVGLTLCATIATALRGDRPPRRRRS